MLNEHVKKLLAESMWDFPPRVEYSLTEKGLSVVPILQSICQWSGAYHKEDTEHTMQHCQKCDYGKGVENRISYF